MNERYLFRGKDEITKEWIYGNYCYVELLNRSGYEHLIVERPASGSTHRVIPETVEQCSGVPDKNGALMYGGDIVNGMFDFEMVIKSICVFRNG